MDRRRFPTAVAAAGFAAAGATRIAQPVDNFRELAS